MAWLVALDGDLVGMRFPLDAPCLVGRGPLNHVVIDDPRISRQHAKISPESGGHMVYDLNSANGTFVNDEPVKRHQLATADVVRFGPFRFRFETEAESKDERLRAGFAGGGLEVRTLVGIEGAANIVDSLDATRATSSPEVTGLAELEDADRKLRTLYSFMHSIATTLDTPELLDRIASNLIEVFADAELCAIYLRDGDPGTMVPRKAVGRDRKPAPAFSLSAQIHDEVVGRGRAILSTPTLPPTRKGRAPQGGLTMHAPMIYRDRTQGVIMVRGTPGRDGQFLQRDLDLLTGLAALAAMALQNARLHAEMLKQQRLSQDLLVAQQIQKSFLPRQLPQVPGVEFITEYQPAYTVGGDFYDVFMLSRNRLGLFIGDVAGKGVSAALLMARISSDLREAALAEPDPSRVLARVNRLVLERNQDDFFVTGVYLTLDLSSHELVLANAGHLPPFIRRREQGQIACVGEGLGTAIGFFADADYRQTRVVLGSGDTLVLCTDGVMEAQNTAGEQFGFARFQASLAAGSSLSREVAQRLLRDLKQHVGDAPQYDDLTLLVCGVTG
ncbi:MAG TPA: SpoIIE family protein phosphatase [Polyangia bacterium]|nr:SpoIIE family protein phosphatase [Polyangia bacterium]